MLLLRCTRRVLDRFKESPRAVEMPDASQGLGQWYVNAAHELDDSFFLCVHAASLYVLVVVVDPDERGVEDLAGKMVARLLGHLHGFGFGEEVLSRVARDYEHVVVAKTASRSVLGSMNELREHFYFFAEEQLTDWDQLDLRRIEAELNQFPHRPIGWSSAVDRLIELCGQLPS